MLERLQAKWRALTLRQRVHLVGVVLITAAAVGHQAAVWDWYIEDAAISFAYARNLADGYGLVPTPGGERVEGYSNPTWVLLLALFELVGVSGFSASKALGLALCAATVPVVYLAAREATSHEDSDAPLLATGFLAMNTQFAIWGGSGLENPLFNLLLAVALWRMFAEVRAGSEGREPFPWSAVAWFGLAVTRPEALAYAAVGGFFSMVWALVDGRGLRPTLKWLAAFWTPFVAYHAARFEYFAWELPQTYYAKVGDHRPPTPLDWTSPGWNYFKNWASATGSGLLLPVLAVGMTGPRATRALIALALSFAWAFPALLPKDHRLLLPVVLVFTYLCYLALIRTQEGGPRPKLALLGLVPVALFVGAAEYMRSQGARGTIPSPDWVDSVPPVMAAVVALAFPLLAWGGRGTRARVVCWALLCGGLGYAVLVHGDWMRSWRWMSLVAVPFAVLLGTGAETVARLAQEQLSDRPDRGPLAYVFAAVLLLAPLPANVLGTSDFVDRPETGPYAVRARVVYKEGLLDTLHWYGPVTDMDVDMGAHLYWTDFRMLDIAGLVDTPFAQHRFDRGFVREYVFAEHKPLFAHLHGGWAGNSKIPTLPEWNEQYVEIPGYGAGETTHIGNHVRRDAIFAEEWPLEPDRSVDFAESIELVGWRVPSPETTAGRRFYVELALRTHVRLTRPFRVLAFLASEDGDTVVAFDMPPTYDWLEIKDWRRSEIFVGRYSPLLPKDLPEGDYALGVVLIGKDGAVIPAAPHYRPGEPDHAPLAPGAILGGVGDWPARYATGEVRFEGAVAVVSKPELFAAADEDHDAALAAAEADRCDEAADHWSRARAHRPRSKDWIDAVGPGLHEAIARCWVRRAEADPDHAVTHVRTARDWDFEAPGVDEAGARVAELRYADGIAARDTGDAEAAYRAFSDVLLVQPHRAWARRYAEQARAERLGIEASTKKERPDLWESRQVRKIQEAEGIEPDEPDEPEGPEGGR